MGGWVHATMYQGWRRVKLGKSVFECHIILVSQLGQLCEQATEVTEVLTHTDQVFLNEAKKSFVHLTLTSILLFSLQLATIGLF